MIAYEPIYATLAFPDEDTGKLHIFEKATKAAPIRKSSVVSKISEPVAPSVSHLKEALASSRVPREAVEAKAIEASKQAPIHRPSIAQTNKLLSKVKGKESIARRASLMTNDEIDCLYRQFTSTITGSIDQQKREVNRMQERVDMIHSKFTDLRSENLESLKITERRLSILKIDPLNPLVHSVEEELPIGSQAVVRAKDDSGSDSGSDSDSNDSIVPPPEEEPPSDDNILYASQSLPHSVGSFFGEQVSSKACQITKNGVPIQEPLRVVTSGPKKFRRGTVLLPTPNTRRLSGPSVDSSPPSRTVTFLPTPSPQSTVSESPGKMFNGAQSIVSESPGNMYNGTKMYRREYNALQLSYYFIDEDTQISQWDAPADGIVRSLDENEREYFTCCATGQCAWKLGDLMSKLT